LVVHSLDNVDLTAVGPVRAESPESGPGTADAAGHVGQIENHHMSVDSVLGLETDTSSAVRGIVVVIYTDVYLSVTVDTDETLVLSGSSVYVLNETVGGISTGKEVELIDESPTGPLLLVSISTTRVVTSVVASIITAATVSSVTELLLCQLPILTTIQIV